MHIRGVPGIAVPFERKIGDMSASPYSRASASRGEISRWLAIVSFSAERSMPRNAGLLLSRSQPPSSRPCCAGRDEVGGGRSWLALLSGGTRKRPVIIDPISLIGPASTTITRWTTMKASSAAAQMKWIERAD